MVSRHPLLSRCASALVIALLALTPAGKLNVMAANASNSLTVAIGYFAPNLDPAGSYDISSVTFLTACYDGLVRATGSSQSKIVPDLATSWQRSPDGKTWTFKLRSGVTFHDGTPVNAAAVKYTWDRLIALGATGFAGVAADFSEISKVEAVNPTTVRFHLAYPFSSFLASLATVWGTGIVSPTTVKKHATAGDPWATKWLLDHEAGSGPYMLHSYDPSTAMTLVKYPAYWGGWSGKHFDQAVIKWIAQSTTQRLLLQRKDLDGTNGLTWQDWTAVSKTPGIIARAYHGQTMIDIRMNNLYGPTANPLVRQALSYAWDYKGMVNGAFSGHATPMVSAGVTGFANLIRPAHPYTFDLAKAKALLAKAGYSKGLTLTYDYFPSQAYALSMGELFQADLASIGVTLKLQSITSPVYTQLESKPQTAPQLFAGAWQMDFPDNQNLYWTAYTNPKRYSAKLVQQIHTLVLAAMKATDAASVTRYYSKAVNLIYSQAIGIWAVQEDDSVALLNTVKGYTYNYQYTSYYYPLYNMYRGS